MKINKTLRIVPPSPLIYVWFIILWKLITAKQKEKQSIRVATNETKLYNLWLSSNEYTNSLIYIQLNKETKDTLSNKLEE